MNWVALVSSVLALLETMGRALEQRRLISAGEAQEAARVLKGALDEISKANRARATDERRTSNPDRVRDDDGFRRD